MHAPDKAIPRPKTRPEITRIKLTGPMCAFGGNRSVDVSGKNWPNKIAYPTPPTAMALRIDRNGVVSRSSIASRKIQKKQNLPRSKVIPRAAPNRSEKAAFAPVPSLPLSKNAAKRSTATIPAAMTVRSESALLQIETSTEVAPLTPPLSKLVSALIRQLPKLFRLDY